MMGKHIPENITRAAKTGFSSPDSSWFKGESIDFVTRVLFDKNAGIYDLMDYKEVTSLVEQHLKGKQNRRLLIWSLIYMEHWMKHYI